MISFCNQNGLWADKPTKQERKKSMEESKDKFLSLTFTNDSVATLMTISDVVFVKVTKKGSLALICKGGIKYFLKLTSHSHVGEFVNAFADFKDSDETTMNVSGSYTGEDYHCETEHTVISR